MKHLGKYLAVPIILTFTAEANAKSFDLGPINADIRANIDLQAASINASGFGASIETNIDWAVRAKLDYDLGDNAKAGIVVKLDQEFDSGSEFSMQRDGINRRLSYAFMKGSWGDLSVGQKPGQADLLSLHAPQVGIGQIRGDFSRYAGRSALLNAYDTQNALKLDYVSPRHKPLTVGLSYAPEIKDRRTGDIRQTDAIEFAAQSRTALSDQWILKTSLAYVTADSANERRQDLNSYSIGSELQYNKKWTVSGAYVYRGNSDAKIGRDETELNFGAKYRQKKLRLALSGAQQKTRFSNKKILGIGGEYKIRKNVRFRVSGTVFIQHSNQKPSEEGTVLITDVRLSY